MQILAFTHQCNPLVHAVYSAASAVPDSVSPGTAAHQAPLSMGSPGASTGVGCHALL